MSVKQRINYMGSKYSLLEYIHEKVIKIGDLDNKIFCDIFGGTHIVGNFFKDKVKNVISNDIEYYSYVIANNYIKNNDIIIINERLNELNNLVGIEGPFYNYFCEGGSSNRLFFSSENGKKMDAIRQKIEKWKIDNLIKDNEYYYLLTSLIEATDKVANTTSVYGAFLKKIKKSASKTMVLLEPEYKIVYGQDNSVYNEDSNELIKKINGDILYIDPPYNQRQYGSNYHILNAIAKYDFTVEPRGITGQMDYNKSKYSSKREVLSTFAELVENANFQHIFISYNNEGIMSEKEIMNILSLHGDAIKYEQEYKTYKADINRNNKSTNTIEFLFYLRKK
ncbi:MAG: DNA adenine methylase [Methanoculleus sp.]|jgi:adenine-specific DNA-methyltransferase|nr:DNA adenine methylase [Methanoculleus sp.]